MMPGMILSWKLKKANMEPTVFFHNPKAGDSDHERGKLLDLLKAQGFSGQYRSVRSKKWQDFDEAAKFLIAAGGDGAVRKVVEMLLRRRLMQRQYPLTVVPLGTANNFSTSFGIESDPAAAIASLKNLTRRKLDIGFVDGAGRKEFFMEGMGAGIFPALMKKAKNSVGRDLSVEERLQAALKVLEQIVRDFRPLPAVVTADGTRYNGEYLMIEIMNIRSIGPNLVLAENADPGDGKLELVLIPVDQREKLLDHIKARLDGQEDEFSYPATQAEELTLSLPATRIHIDDKAKQYKGGEFRVYLNRGILDILAPVPD